MQPGNRWSGDGTWCGNRVDSNRGAADVDAHPGTKLKQLQVFFFILGREGIHRTQIGRITGDCDLIFCRKLTSSLRVSASGYFSIVTCGGNPLYLDSVVTCFSESPDGILERDRAGGVRSERKSPTPHRNFHSSSSAFSPRFVPLFRRTRLNRIQTALCGLQLKSWAVRDELIAIRCTSTRYTTKCHFGARPRRD